MTIKDSAKTVVCYGDSNTWGRIPGGARYPRSVRWTGVLQNLLGDEYEVRNEGLSARTLVVVDPEKPERTGITHLKSILRTNKPIDAVIIMLGINDLKSRFNLTTKDIAGHLEQTINLIKEEGIDKILVVAPPNIVVPDSGVMRADLVRNLDVKEELPKFFRDVSQKYNCNFIDAGQNITCSKLDGLHLDADMHRKLAEILRAEILKMFT